MSGGLSAYEEQRAATIARNRDYLVKLGIDKPLIPTQPKTPVRKRQRQEALGGPDHVERRANPRRSAAAPAVRKRADEDDEYSPETSEGEEEEEEFSSSLKARKPTVRTKPQIESDAAALEGKACIITEKAKTGRSKCRRCLEMLEADAPRVGMESWMVGRQVMVWQHPACFASGLEVTVEASGRGKCKQTKATFSVGEHRISATAHTTTAHLKLEAAPALLRPVWDALPSHDGTKLLQEIKGWSNLSPNERRKFEADMAADTTHPASAAAEELGATALGSAGGPAKTGRKLSQKSAGSGSSATPAQPAEGRVSKAKGKVCWKFAGALCYGTLLPAKETALSCYARTHKGNIKTLAKGKPYWWLLEESGEDDGPATN